MTEPSTAEPKIRGLDAIRFVAALIVALSHGAAPPFAEWFGKTALWSRALVGLSGIMFNGVAAVLVFFVISGFCIHYSYARGALFRWAPFYARRGLRILIPFAAALLLSRLLGRAAQSALGAVIWSIYCELIYYLLYPILRIGFASVGLRLVLVAVSVISAGIVLLQWNVLFYWGFSPAVTWLVCMPAWLLGCVLAERAAGEGGGLRLGRVAPWRAGVLAYAVATVALFFHAPFRIGYPALLSPFYLVIYFWLLAEIQRFRTLRPWAWLEWCGRWSFSLYLMHNMAIALTPLRAGSVLGDWILRLCAIFVGSLIFYLLLEAPSHRLARIVSRRLDGWLARFPSPRGQLAA